MTAEPTSLQATFDALRVEKLAYDLSDLLDNWRDRMTARNWLGLYKRDAGLELMFADHGYSLTRDVRDRYAFAREDSPRSATDADHLRYALRAK